MYEVDKMPVFLFVLTDTACGWKWNPGFPQQLGGRGLLVWLWLWLKCREDWALSFSVMLSNLNSNWPRGLLVSDNGTTTCPVHTLETLAPSFTLRSTSRRAPWWQGFLSYCLLPHPVYNIAWYVVYPQSIFHDWMNLSYQVLGLLPL